LTRGCYLQSEWRYEVGFRPQTASCCARACGVVLVAAAPSNQLPHGPTNGAGSMRGARGRGLGNQRALAVGVEVQRAGGQPQELVQLALPLGSRLKLHCFPGPVGRPHLHAQVRRVCGN